MKNFFKLFIYFITFIAVGAVSVLLVYKVVNFDEMSEVPSMVGKSVTEAAQMLNERKLFLNIERKEHNEEVPEGNIVSQNIEPGQEIRIGSEVGVVVSKGTEIYSMPSFEGQLLDDARLTLANLGIQIKKITPVHSDTVEKGRIIAQRPLPGNIDSNEIHFLVSLGPYEALYRCPSFVNMTIDDARMLAGELGIKLKEKGKGSRIIFQKPEAGVAVKRDDAVEVTLGRGWGMWF
jgi:beta-lactam-binding protein with PASTA domain